MRDQLHSMDMILRMRDHLEECEMHFRRFEGLLNVLPLTHAIRNRDPSSGDYQGYYDEFSQQGPLNPYFIQETLRKVVDCKASIQTLYLGLYAQIASQQGGKP